MAVELTIGIPTANRPEKLRACLDSIKEHVDFAFKLIIVDSSSEDLRYKPDDWLENTEIIVPTEMLSPSHARKIIAEKCDTPMLLYLDDDMTVSEGALQELIDYLKCHKDVDIVGAAVNEYGYWRDIGLFLMIGEVDGSRVVVKKPVRKEWMDKRGLESLRVDLITQPPFLMRTGIFKKVNFDENYLWASEIYDFFFQCLHHGIVSVVIPSAVFHHFPTRYAAPTHKQSKRRHNLAGKEYFHKKWNTKIHSFARQRLLFEFLEAWRHRRDKRKMVKKKIELDGV